MDFQEFYLKIFFLEPVSFFLFFSFFPQNPDGKGNTVNRMKVATVTDSGMT